MLRVIRERKIDEAMTREGGGWNRVTVPVFLVFVVTNGGWSAAPSNAPDKQESLAFVHASVIPMGRIESARLH